MKLNPTLNKFRQAAKTGEFIKFSYRKEGETVETQRVIRVGGDISKRMEKQNSPILGEKGKGNWINGAEKSGKNSMILRKNGRIYLRGTEIKRGESKHKCFLLSGITVK